MDDNKEKILLKIVPYSQTITETSVTRAERPEGYTAFNGNNAYSSNEIAVFMAKDGSASLAGNFKPKNDASGSWESQVSAEKGTAYHLFGYYPADCTNNASISYSNYANGATITLPNLDTFSFTDVSVITGVNDLGSYSYTMPTEGESKIERLFLDHIYTCIRLSFKVDEDYDKLRTIKLKDVRIGKNSSYKKMKATILMNTTADVRKGVTWKGEDPAEDFTSDNLLSGQLTLTTDFQNQKEVFTPGSQTVTFNIVSIYDVYDKKGNCIREDCKATNKISLTNSKAEAGKRTTIKLTVKPTYLYQLSEPELDNPTIVAGT